MIEGCKKLSVPVLFTILPFFFLFSDFNRAFLCLMLPHQDKYKAIFMHESARLFLREMTFSIDKRCICINGNRTYSRDLPKWKNVLKIFNQIRYLSHLYIQTNYCYPPKKINYSYDFSFHYFVIHGETLYINFYYSIFQFREKGVTLRIFVSKNTKLYNNDMKL